MKKPDQQFNYEEVISITGSEYVLNMHHEGIAFLPYEKLKHNVAMMMAEEPSQPFITTSIPIRLSFPKPIAFLNNCIVI